MIGYDAEKNADYFKAVWDNAVDLSVMLCEAYGFNPEKDIICHCEGYKLGVASNHADVMHWFPKHGQSMDTFRAEVKKRLEEKSMTKSEAKTIVKDKTGLSDTTISYIADLYAWGEKTIIALASAMK